MNYTQFVDILYTGDDLLKEFASFFFLKSVDWKLPLILYNILEQFTARSILSYQVEMSRVFDDLFNIRLLHRAARCSDDELALKFGSP